jgi:hypothetical protein
MATETVYGKYKYNNRVRGTVKPSIKNKMEQDMAMTGVSQSSIVAAALEEYYKNKTKAEIETRLLK